MFFLSANPARPCQHFVSFMLSSNSSVYEGGKRKRREKKVQELAKYKNRTKLELISQISLKNEGALIKKNNNLGNNSISFTPLLCFEVIILDFFWKTNNDSKICPLHIYNNKWTPWLLLSLVLLKGLIIVTAEEVTLTRISHSWRTHSWQKKKINHTADRRKRTKWQLLLWKLSENLH